MSVYTYYLLNLNKYIPVFLHKTLVFIHTPVFAAYCFCIILIYILKIYRFIYRNIFYKIRVDDKYIKDCKGHSKHLAYFGLRFTPKNRSYYAHQESKFHSIFTGIIYLLIWVAFGVSLLILNLLGGKVLWVILFLIIFRCREEYVSM